MRRSEAFEQRAAMESDARRWWSPQVAPRRGVGPPEVLDELMHSYELSRDRSRRPNRRFDNALPSPTFGIVEIDGDFTPVMSVPMDEVVAYYSIRSRLQKAYGVVRIVGYAPARAAGGVRISRDGGNVTGSVCGLVDRGHGIEVLTCAHVLTDLDTPSNDTVELRDDDGALCDATVSVLRSPVVGTVNRIDAGLARPTESFAGSQLVAAGVRPDLFKLSQATKWGASTGTTLCEVEQIAVGPFDITYPELFEPVRFTDLIKLRSQHRFADVGDSGGLVWDSVTDQAFGMLVATSVVADHDGYWVAYATPLPDILTILGANWA